MNRNDNDNVLVALTAVPGLFRDIPAIVKTLLLGHGIVTCEQALVYVRWLLRENQRDRLRELELDADVMRQFAERLLDAIHPGMAARLDDEEGRLWLDQRPLGVLPPLPSALDEAVEEVRRMSREQDETDGPARDDDEPSENGGGS